MQANECPERKRVYKAMAGVVGPSQKVINYLDEPEDNDLDVATFGDLPEAGLVTYATVTMHGSGNEMGGQNVPVELMVIGRQGDSAVIEVLVEAAFTVGKDGWLAAPGVVFPDFVAHYFPDSSTPHLMWMEPFVWPELGTIDIPNLGHVSCLLALPITDAEWDLLHTAGFDALGAALETADVPYTDLWRASTV